VTSKLRFLCILLLLAMPSVGQENAPRPYSAQQIRDFHPVGFKCLFWSKTGDVHSHSHWEVVRSTPEEVEFEFEETDGDGRTTDKRRQTFRWEELRNHATFPASQTHITDVRRKTPLGTFDCWLYTIKDEKGEKRFYFAKDKPGAPIEFGTWVDGEQVMRSVIMELTVPGRSFEQFIEE
jgi:hypothetical protein